MAAPGKPVRTWWSEGVRFECQGSGQCCVSRGEYGYVFLTPEDRRRLAKFLKISTQAFTKKYCSRFHGAFHLNEDPERPECMFLHGRRCDVYQARPGQCRTWPFWSEVMSPKAWKKEVATFCPGVGKGKVVSPEEIRRQMAEQKKVDDAVVAESQKNR